MSQKKKIIHIIQSLGNGGCENILLRTLPIMDDFEHHIITLKELGELAPKCVSAGIPVTTIHCDGIFDIPGILRLRKHIREENPNIILTYLFHADMIGRLFLKKSIPIIPFLRTTYNHPKYLIARILEWVTKPLVNHYLANSEAVKNFYSTHIGVQTEKITVIPNGIDTEYFDSITPDPKLRDSLNIKPSDFVIICVANLHKNKGHQYLLEAFEMCALKNSKLLIVGDGTEKENLLHQIKNYQSKENILFLGKRNDVPKLLKISHLFILPTLFEGMSNALMEAMASELPIITTDIPENQTLIQNNITGLLVPIKSPFEIKKAIQLIQESKEYGEKIKMTGKLSIKESFDLKKTVLQFSRFLKSL